MYLNVSLHLNLLLYLGGFGVDRFYLGQWEAGIGKLFSFGGAGVWTLLDVMFFNFSFLPYEFLHFK